MSMLFSKQRCVCHNRHCSHSRRLSHGDTAATSTQQAQQAQLSQQLRQPQQPQQAQQAGHQKRCEQHSSHSSHSSQSSNRSHSSQSSPSSHSSHISHREMGAVGGLLSECSASRSARDDAIPSMFPADPSTETHILHARVQHSVHPSVTASSALSSMYPRSATCGYPSSFGPARPGPS